MEQTKKQFVKICKKNQKELKKYVKARLMNTHKKVVEGNGYVYAEGTMPVLLVAHLDTVHKWLPTVTHYDEKTFKLSSPMGIGGDDRCGVYMIFEVLKKHHCSVLFCEDEEIGGVGASKFIKSEDAKGLAFNYMIEFDRRGSKDAVFYNCDNPEFEKFITQEFYKTSYGSFSDISTLAPHFGCAAVNLSCGYYSAHTTDEYVLLNEMMESVDAACEILDRTNIEEDKFEYIEKKYNYSKYGKYSNYDYSEYYKGWSTGWSNEPVDSKTSNGVYKYDSGDIDYDSDKYDYDIVNEEKYYLICYTDGGKEKWCEVWAANRLEAVGEFCMEHPNIPYSQVSEVYTDQDVYGSYSR